MAYKKTWHFMIDETIRKKIVFAVGHDVIIRNFIDAGVLNEISQKYDITYLCSDSLSRQLRISGTIYIDFNKKQNSFKKKVDLYLWYLAYFKYLRKTSNLEEGLSCSFKSSILSKWTKKILLMLSLPVVYEFVMWFFGTMVISFDKEILKVLKKIKPEVIIAPGCTFDSFGMQVINAARRLKIKTIMPVAHWDYFSRKGVLRIIPDHVCVWGQQMRDLVVNFHKIPKKKVSIIGVPHFQIYFDYYNNLGVKKEVNSLQTRNLLFAGSGIPYDELTPLKILDSQISCDRSDRVKIIYRPHPKQYPRKCQYFFKQEDYKNTILNSKQVSQIGDKSAYEPMEYYLDLLNNVDGVITPFSTMLLEAAVCGKPSFILAFSDGIHDWKIENLLKAEHIFDLLGFEWMVFCKKKDELEEKFNDFLKIVNTPGIAEKIRKDVKCVAYYDSDSFQRRFANFLDRYVAAK